jgi:uncharacterized protein (TIGR02996 family)
MTREGALLAAILGSPGDDAPRLVYADWLDENAGAVPCPECRGPTPPSACDGRPIAGSGSVDPAISLRWQAHRRGVCRTCLGRGTVPDGRAARAAFIRVQCELANTPDHFRVGGGADDVVDNPRFFDLRRRERELLAAHEPRWLQEILVPEWLPASAIHWEWRRGFIEMIACEAAVWLAHGDAVRRAQPVTRVRLTTWRWRGGVEIDWENQYRIRCRLPGRAWHVVPADPPWEPGPARARDRWPSRLLTAEWPGVVFELPAPETAAV